MKMQIDIQPGGATAPGQPSGVTAPPAVSPAVRPPRLHRGGRPTVRTPQLVASILDMVASGMPLMLASKAAEISYQTFSNWRRQDASLETQLQAAIAKGVRENLRVVRRCMASKDEGVALRASCWYLEHVHPEHFARNRIEVTGADGSPLAAAVAIFLPQKQDGNGSPVVVPALAERPHGNGG